MPSVIKIREEDYPRLMRVVSEIQANNTNKRITVGDAINFLLNEHERRKLNI
jgi:hypothetical protein